MHIICSFENDVIQKKKMVAEDKAVVIVCFGGDAHSGAVQRERGIQLVDDIFVPFSALSLCPCTACTCAQILPSVAPPRSSGRAPCFKQHLATWDPVIIYGWVVS